jgi:hypothetical protein
MGTRELGITDRGQEGEQMCRWGLGFWLCHSPAADISDFPLSQWINEVIVARPSMLGYCGVQGVPNTTYERIRVVFSFVFDGTGI